MQTNLTLGLKRTMLIMGTVVAASLALSSCSKSVDAENTPIAGLIAFNVATDQNYGIGISLSGSEFLSSALGYANYTGGYQAVATGQRIVRSYSATTGSTMAQTTTNFELGKYYSVVVAGANGNYRNLVVEDKYDELPTSNGNIFIRYFNTIPDSSKLTVTITPEGNPAITDANVGFGAISDFKELPAGNVIVSITNGSNIVASKKKEDIKSNQVYAVLLAGIPSSTGADSIDVKFAPLAQLSN
ncbi:DUF4397 domain-containing protein [Filimonas effusa]|uniref:DUF4397 domain-containing protein n=1 Tax=Filimonas effusa TaxID=2508721 RepID=A0A4Q1D5G6_9BACT|nr:DUF4397 domain-containing protein [Filimonas effusa]RXK83699.1 DUF4397 domain-containing protein [Filimonas effusa]